MSFLLRKFTDYLTKYGKENDLCMAQHSNPISQTLRERTSAFTSKGSITLEAALATGFFFLAALCLVYIFEIMCLETVIQNGLHRVGKEIAVEAYVNPVISHARIEQALVENIGAKRLDRSLIVDGSNGLDCSGSKQYWNTTIMDLTVSYQMEIPIFLFRVPLIGKEEAIRIKGWTGYEAKGIDALGTPMVYVTDYGIVYHKDSQCTYLDLSIKMVNRQELANLRNQSGSTYKPCSSCKGKGSDNQKVYVTDYGERYHSSLECSGLKRKIYTIALTDVHGLGGCSKCVK